MLIVLFQAGSGAIGTVDTIDAMNAIDTVDISIWQLVNGYWILRY